MKRSTESLTLADFQLHPDRDLTVLIPARAGSKRVPGKNTRLLGGKPLILWTIDAAKAAHVATIIVSSDCPVALELAAQQGCHPHTRAAAHATDTSPDFEWVQALRPQITTPYFAILRPTSPFRTASTIRRAFALLVGSEADSVRAVQRVTYPHPAKMWTLPEGSRYIQPVVHWCHQDGTPYHSSPTQTLPAVYMQNASLEMARTDVIDWRRTISGIRIAPFFTDALEGFDINTEEDFVRAEQIAATVASCSAATH